LSNQKELPVKTIAAFACLIWLALTISVFFIK
jgi:hypothetical protein